MIWPKNDRQFVVKTSRCDTEHLLSPANEVCEGYVFTGVCLQEGKTWAGTPPQVHPLGRYTPQAGTPPRQVHPPGRYTPQAGTPTLAGTPPGRYNPLVGTPPTHLATVHAGIRSISGRYASHWNAFLLIH